MPIENKGPGTGPNDFDDAPWYKRMFMRQPGEPEVSWPRRIFRGLMVLVILATIAYFFIPYVHQTVDGWFGSGQTAVKQQTSGTNATPSSGSTKASKKKNAASGKTAHAKTANVGPLPVAPAAIAPNVDATVFCPPEDMLAKTRTARVASMELDIAHDLRHHKLTKAQAVEKLAFLHANPDGWNEKTKTSSNYSIDGDKVLVTWDGAIGLHSVAHCSCSAESSITYPPPVVSHVFIPYIPKMRVGRCYTATMYVHPGDEIILGYHSPGETLHPETGCDFIIQGNGQPEPYFSDVCDGCRPIKDIAEAALRKRITLVRTYVFIAQARKITVSYDASVLGMVPFICDRSTETRWIYLTPPGTYVPDDVVRFSWHSHHIEIPAAAWLPDPGGEASDD